MFEMETRTATTTLNGATMVTKMIGVGPMFQLKNGLQKMMRRFDIIDEHAKESRNDLANIAQMVD